MESVKLYEFQENIINHLLEFPHEDIIIMKSRQVGMSTAIREYLKKSGKKTLYVATNLKSTNFIKEIRGERVVVASKLSYMDRQRGHDIQEIILDEANWIINEHNWDELTKLVTMFGARTIMYSSIDHQDSFFWKKFNENNHFKKIKIHWSISPRLNPAYPTGIDYSVVNEIKKSLGEKSFNAECEMQPYTEKENHEKTLSFRLSQEEHDCLMKKIKAASLERGRQYTISEFIKSKIFLEEVF